MPVGQRVAFEDFVRGTQQFATDDIGDFIVRRADGNAAFFFCNAVDDALMGVTHVLRGDDHLTNTPRQILLLEALGLRVPQYGHVALITGADGAPLSKRHGSVSVREFRERGFLPEAIVNHLFRLGHSSDHEAWLALDEMPAHFRLDHLGRAPARFDETQLAHWQKEALARASAQQVERWLQPLLPQNASPERVSEFVEVVRHNVVLPEDARPWVDIAFGDLPVVAEEDRRVVAEARPEFFSAAVEAFDAHGADLQALSAELRAATGRKGAALYTPLRVALTGRRHGPELAPLLKLMPPATCAGAWNTGHARSIRGWRMLRIHNSLTGTKEEFRPLHPPRVGMYVCGMTVYDYCHIGHARMLVVFDVVRRYLRSLGYQRHLRAQHHRHRRQDHQARRRERRVHRGADRALHPGNATRTAPRSASPGRIASRAPPSTCPESSG